MTFWLTTFTVINFFLLVTLVFLITRLKGVEKLRHEDRNRIVNMSELRESMNQLLQETWEASETLGKEIDRYREVMARMESVLDNEKSTIKALTHEFQRNVSREADPAVAETPQDKYSEALQLSKTGLSAEEISKRINIPLGEVELALQMRK
jgi:DNA-directed RNA polymerase specialized sigma24 family protein